MDEKAPSTIRTPEVKTSAVDFETGLKHIIGPAVIGVTLGMLTPGLFFIMIWFSGWGALFCGAYGPLLIWVWISTSWGQFDLPPFRYGIWHSFAINIGGFAGAILAFNLSL